MNTFPQNLALLRLFVSATTDFTDNNKRQRLIDDGWWMREQQQQPC